MIITVGVGNEIHPVLVWIKVNLAPPLLTAVTKPASVTVHVELLLYHVPPVVGDKVVVVPIQIESRPVILTVGNGFIVTVCVAKEAHPVLVCVNVNVGAPLATPVTRPPLVTVAKALLLLAHVPPVVGESVVVAPTHIAFAPVILTVGFAFTVTVGVMDVQPVPVWVNVNVAEPLATPVTTPALVTVATALLLLTQVPPVVGDKVVVAPAHIALTPVILTVGFAFTVTWGVAKDAQPVLVSVKVNVAVPPATPVTTPASVTVAKVLLLLAHVPPVVGDSVVVFPSHIVLAPVILTIGFELTVIWGVAKDTHPVLVWVKVNVAVLLATPVTSPVLVTVATALLLLTQVPPVVGVKVVVAPKHMAFAPVILTIGFAFTVTWGVDKDAQPVLVWVKVNVAMPLATPVTTPVLATVATALLLLAHVPPVVGDKVVVAPAQIVVAPVILTVGFAFTITWGVGKDVQTEPVWVNVNVTVPLATPVTTPVLATVATALLLLAHVPPVVGDKVVVVPTQIELAPVILTEEPTFTVTEGVAKDTQPVLVSVNVNVGVPLATPVTTPAFVTVAKAILLLAQVPPVVGDKVVVVPAQIVFAPVMLTVGFALIVTSILTLWVSHPFALVLVTQ
jgi:hypothetical protein